jgi:hypothetical protein
MEKLLGDLTINSMEPVEALEADLLMQLGTPLEK